VGTKFSRWRPPKTEIFEKGTIFFGLFQKFLLFGGRHLENVPTGTAGISIKTRSI
jgi:hypothetical protein